MYDRKKLVINNANSPVKSETKELLRISFPLLISRYCTSFLRTGENILVPKTLSDSLSYSTALSRFGAVKGMALPVLFFPSSVLNALSALLLPEMSEAVAKNKPYIIKNAVKKTLQTTWLLGVIFGAIFFFCGENIGKIIYKDTVSGELIKILSVIVPLMYLDSICDGILKGLDQQSYTFFTALADSLLRIILILLFVPKFSMNGFLCIMIFSNVFTCVLHVGKLLRLTGLAPNPFKDIMLPIICAALICYFCYTFLSFLTQPVIFTAVFALFSCVLFAAAAVIFKIVDIHDYI
jgi:stage V sporulation protein B